MTPLTDKQETAAVLRQYNGEPAYQRMLASEQASVAGYNTPEAQPLARQAYEETSKLDIRPRGQQESEATE